MVKDEGGQHQQWQCRAATKTSPAAADTRTSHATTRPSYLASPPTPAPPLPHTPFTQTHALHQLQPQVAAAATAAAAAAAAATAAGAAPDGRTGAQQQGLAAGSGAIAGSSEGQLGLLDDAVTMPATVQQQSQQPQQPQQQRHDEDAAILALRQMAAQVRRVGGRCGGRSGASAETDGCQVCGVGVLCRGVDAVGCCSAGAHADGYARGLCLYRMVQRAGAGQCTWATLSRHPHNLHLA